MERYHSFRELGVNIMKMLVLGGTSFFGKDIVELALDAGHKVTVFSRGNQRPDFWNRVDHIIGDRTNKIDFAKKLANKLFDAVIDNIAYNREHVVNAIDVFQGNIGRYLLTSSIAVYFGMGPFDQPVGEADGSDFELNASSQVVSAPRPTPPWVIDYANGKIESENAVIRERESALYDHPSIECCRSGGQSWAPTVLFPTTYRRQSAYFDKWRDSIDPTCF